MAEGFDMSINTTSREDITEGLTRSIVADEAIKAKSVERDVIASQTAEYLASGKSIHPIPLGYTTIRMEATGRNSTKRWDKEGKSV